MANRRYSKKIKDAAATLVIMVDSGKYTGIEWTWAYIGEILGLTPAQARQVIYYIREHNDDFIWTVGTYKSGYTTQPSTSMIEALPGEINQYRHTYTRDRSHQRVWKVLSTVDPDPKRAKFAQREARWWGRRADECRDHMEHLVDEVGGLG